MLRAKEWKEKFRVLEKPVDAVGLAKRRIQKYKRTEEQRKLKEQEKSRGQRWYQKRSKLKTGTNNNNGFINGPELARMRSTKVRKEAERRKRLARRQEKQKSIKVRESLQKLAIKANDYICRQTFKNVPGSYLLVRYHGAAASTEVEMRRAENDWKLHPTPWSASGCVNDLESTTGTKWSLRDPETLPTGTVRPFGEFKSNAAIIDEATHSRKRRKRIKRGMSKRWKNYSLERERPAKGGVV